ncbi:Ribosome production factor 1 [Thecaphora frezii]
MASDREPDSDGRGSVKHIGNKIKRLEVYRKFKADKKKQKLERRIQIKKEEKGPDGKLKKKARLEANKPRTIETTRDYNPTIINAPNTHEGPGPSNSAAASEHVGDGDDAEAEAQPQQEALPEDDDDEDPHAPPAILITTSMPSNTLTPHLESLNARAQPAERTRDFIKELLNVFPGSEYRPRAKARGAGLGKICGWARDRRYDAVIVVGENRKEPFALTIVSLPRGPTAFFRLTSLSMGKELYGHARPTQHTPELILNNFTTVLGHRVGGVLQSLFPKIPQLEGRQVVTCHNQRDYVFFRRHRYAFKSEDKTALQEIGPRFTLKLHSLKDSLPKGAGVWDGKYKGEFAELEPDELGEDGEDSEDELAPVDGDSDDEKDAEAEMQAGNSSGQSGDKKSKSKTSKAEERPKKRLRERGAEDVVTTEFQWKPKMSVSRRNFYL